MGTATAYWTIAKKGKGTEATWSVDADMGNNPMARLMGQLLVAGELSDDEAKRYQDGSMPQDEALSILQRYM